MTEPTHQVRLEWQSRMRAAGVPCGLVRSVGEALRSEEARDHALLYAGDEVIDLVGLDPAEPGPAE